MRESKSTTCGNTIPANEADLEAIASQLRNAEFKGMKSVIRITHDAQIDNFKSQKAILYAIEQIGCERFFNAQKGRKVISKERPANAKDNQIIEIKDDYGHWYVYDHSGIAQRVTFLSNIFKALNLDWTAERN